jgi:hypothetical protein
MKQSMLFLLAFCIASPAQTTPRKSVRAWFRDGTGIEIHTETTGPTQAVTHEPGQGVIGIAYDRSFRLITDKANNVLFGYYLDGKKSTVPNAEFIRISPIDSAALPSRLDGRYKYPPGSLPTVDTAREFPAVKIGQAVTLDILFNPSTGEKIYDVIRPLTEPSPATAPNRSVVTGGGVGEQLSLKEILLRVNGQKIDAPSSWMLGAAARIDVPGHGLFIISAYDPKNPLFRPAVNADRNTLTWLADGQRVEITSKSNVLSRSESATIWVYYDPYYKSADSPNNVGLQAADTVEWLLPKK